MTPSREGDVATGLGLAAFIVALWAQHSGLAGTFYDDGIYLILARGLAEGHSLVYTHLPGTPDAVHFPPLYPWLLSLMWRVWPEFPSNLALFQVFDALCFALAASLVFRHSRVTGLAVPVRLAAVAAGVFAFPMLAIIGVRFSEPLFLLLMAAAFLCADAPASPRRAALAGLLVALAALARSLGIVAVLAVPAAYAVRRRWREAGIALATGLVLILPWMIHVARAATLDPVLEANYGSYSAVFAGLGPIQLLLGADLRVIEPAARLLLPALPGWLFLTGMLVLAGLTIRGGVILFSRAPALVLTLAGYAALVTVWPYLPDRFVWVILPWLLVLLAVAVVDAWNRQGWRRWSVAVVVAVVAAGFVPRQAVSLLSRGFARAAEGISVPFPLVISSIRQELPADAVIATELESLVALYTGHQTVPSAAFQWVGRERRYFDASAMLDFWCRAGVTHLVVSGGGTDGAQVARELATRAGVIERMFAVTDGPAMYRVTCAN